MPLPPLLWSAGPAQPVLQDAEVHVWAVPLDLSAEEIAACLKVLDSSEQERAARRRFEPHRSRFIAARASLRMVLARYVKTTPEEIQFAYGPHGKPSLQFPTSPVLEFNATDSDDLVLVAVTAAGPVGVDVERIRALKDADALVKRFFSPRENDLFQKLPEEQKPVAFFNLWTRKEAFLKGTGEGISHSLNRVEVSFLPGKPAAFLPGATLEGLARWALQELVPAEGFAAALATRFPPSGIQCWRWEHTSRYLG
jgi:4'-phosphopantetheinyl transferase